MSSKRGDVKRSRPQRHQNGTAFKNDLHDKSDKIKRLNSMSINEVCVKCADVIQWKIKYRKYKPLKQPKSCTRCNQRTVKKAYHVICRDCVILTKQCAKCLQTESEEHQVQLIAPEPTEQERQKLDIEMQQMLKTLSERKRRTFLRFMNGRRKNKRQNESEDYDDQISEKQPGTRTKEELLAKLEQLKVSDKQENDDDEFYDSISSDDEESC